MTAAALPRVTAILSASGLVDSRFFTDEARERGTAVHKAIHYLNERDLNTQSVDLRVAPYLAAYRKFIKENCVTVLRSEFEVCNTIIPYCGHPDIEADFHGAKWIVDVKAGASCPWHPLQTAAYENCIPETMRRACLYLRPPNYQLVEHNDHRDWAVFRSAAVLYHWREKHGLIFNSEAG